MYIPTCHQTENSCTEINMGFFGNTTLDCEWLSVDFGTQLGFQKPLICNKIIQEKYIFASSRIDSGVLFGNKVVLNLRQFFSSREKTKLDLGQRDPKVCTEHLDGNLGHCLIAIPALAFTNRGTTTRNHRQIGGTWILSLTPSHGAVGNSYGDPEP